MLICFSRVGEMSEGNSKPLAQRGYPSGISQDYELGEIVIGNSSTAGMNAQTFPPGWS
jgi:hypothetical protein